MDMFPWRKDDLITKKKVIGTFKNTTRKKTKKNSLLRGKLIENKLIRVL